VRLLARRPALALAAVHGGNAAAAAELDTLDREIAEIDRRLELLQLAAAEAQRLADVECQQQEAEQQRSAEAAAQRAAALWVEQCYDFMSGVEGGHVDLVLARHLGDAALAAEWARRRDVGLHVSEWIQKRMAEFGFPVPLVGSAALASDLQAAQLAAEVKGPTS